LIDVSANEANYISDILSYPPGICFVVTLSLSQLIGMVPKLDDSSAAALGCKGT